MTWFMDMIDRLERLGYKETSPPSKAGWTYTKNGRYSVITVRISPVELCIWRERRVSNDNHS